MKTLNLIFALALTLLLSEVVNSQNITGTLGTNGVFKIKDASNDYLTLSQTNGNLSLFRNLELGVDSISTSTRGVITKNGRRFIHNYQAPGTDGFNTFVGLEAGNFTMNGYATFHSSYNTAVGYRSLSSLTTGNTSSAFGYYSLNSNTTGNSNSAFGYFSLYSNTTGTQNSAFGSTSLRYNTTGSYNAAFGYQSLLNNSIGYANSAFGFQTLTNNSTGNLNSAFGYVSLYSNTTGIQNTAIGTNSGGTITTGSNNTAIGYDAQVPSGTSSNQIRLGNTAITYAGIQVAWTVTSDRRYKDNITPLGLGLGFISKLNPVSYVRKNDENKKTEYGLIAQEVEEVLKELGIENHGMLTVTDEGMYELRYNDLIAPMIKAIQELKEKSDVKDNEIANLKEENRQLRSEIQLVKSLSDEVQNLKQIINSLTTNSSDVKLTISGKEEK